jgi:hypothetical protein
VLAAAAGLVMVAVGRNKAAAGAHGGDDDSAGARFLRALDRSSPNLVTVVFC